MSGAPPPSSFDDNHDFYEESRWQKLKRRLVEEPLIPLGCILTCWALLEATKSIRSGDKAKTNRMFRRRIYAQGFTILAMLGGSAYWETDRSKRRQFDELIEERQAKEKHEQWIRELEIREQEESLLREARKRAMQVKTPAKAKAVHAELTTGKGTVQAEKVEPAAKAESRGKAETEDKTGTAGRTGRTGTEKEAESGGGKFKPKGKQQAAETPIESVLEQSECSSSSSRSLGQRALDALGGQWPRRGP